MLALVDVIKMDINERHYIVNMYALKKEEEKEEEEVVVDGNEVKDKKRCGKKQGRRTR